MASTLVSGVVAMWMLFACFHPNYDRPACGPNAECPSGLSCGPQGICEEGGVGPPTDPSCKDDTGCNATPDQPVCKIVDNVGVCVECTPEKRARCPLAMPICTNDKCGPCTRHSDCTESNVCTLDGSCALETEVAYVDGTVGTNQATCSKTMPCNRIDTAAMTARRFVKVSGTVTNRTTLDNRNVVILADPGARLAPSTDDVALEVRGTSQVQIFDLVITHAAPGPAREGVTVDDTGDLRMTRVSIRDNNADGVRVTGGKLTCTLCTIAQNTGLGIIAVDGKVTISQSTIQNNVGGGILISTSVDEFQIVGNVFFNNGSATAATGGIRVADVTSAPANRIDFNSLSRNEAMSGVEPGIRCATPVGLNLTARYNIIWNNGPAPVFGDQVNAEGCEHTSSDIGPVRFGTNVNMEPGFIDETGGDLHLMRSHALLTVTPNTSELAGLAARDIDDQPRGATTDVGADHVPRPL